MRVIFFVLVLSAVLAAQGNINRPTIKKPFTGLSDSTLTGDGTTSVDFRFKIRGLTSGSWVDVGDCSNYSGSLSDYFDLSALTGWTYADSIQFRILNSGDTLTSNVLSINYTEGMLTLGVEADTMTTDNATILTTILKGR